MVPYVTKITLLGHNSVTVIGNCIMDPYKTQPYISILGTSNIFEKGLFR